VPRNVYQLKVTLAEIQPPIWRRLAVRGGTSLAKLHLILQDVMGWSNSHLYALRIGKKSYEDPDPEARGANARRVSLDQLKLRQGDEFEYDYDFGDDWRHILLVEAVVPPMPGAQYPVCLDGQRACPPEDCGGVSGYANILEALEHPADPEFREVLEWLDPGYDPETFDLRATNRILQLAHAKGAV
jgi:hypothetical protein